MAATIGCVFAVLNIPLVIWALFLFAVGFLPPDLSIKLFLTTEDQAIAFENLSIDWRDPNVLGEVNALSIMSVSIGAIYTVLSLTPIIFSCCLEKLRRFLYIYVVFIGLLLVCLVSLTFFLGAGQQYVFSMLRSTLRSGYESTTNKRDAVTMLWNTVQLTLQCCGYDGGVDYNGKIATNSLSILAGGDDLIVPKDKKLAMIIPPSCCTVQALKTPASVMRDKTGLHPVAQCVFYTSSYYSNFQYGCADKLWPYAMTLFGITMASCWYLLFLVAVATDAITYRPVADDVYLAPVDRTNDHSSFRRQSIRQRLSKRLSIRLRYGGTDDPRAASRPYDAEELRPSIQEVNRSYNNAL